MSPYPSRITGEIRCHHSCRSMRRASALLARSATMEDRLSWGRLRYYALYCRTQHLIGDQTKICAQTSPFNSESGCAAVHCRTSGGAGHSYVPMRETIPPDEKMSRPLRGLCCDSSTQPVTRRSSRIPLRDVNGRRLVHVATTTRHAGSNMKQLIVPK